MEFINILNNLKSQYADDCILRKNETLLLGPGKIPKSRYMLFKPLNDEYIDQFLVSQYKNEFPKEYIEFLKYSNGADLYTVKIKSGKFEYAYNLFTIYGLPLTQPFGRPFDMEEPFDIRVEDLARHDDIPATWLKCGKYIKEYDMNTINDIFIDTETLKVYSCVKNEKDIIDSWNSLDECFCSIFDYLSESGLVYSKNKKDGSFFCVDGNEEEPKKHFGFFKRK